MNKEGNPATISEQELIDEVRAILSARLARRFRCVVTVEMDGSHRLYVGGRPLCVRIT